MIHLCTSESLVAGGIEIAGTCQICQRETSQTAGFIGSLCHECGYVSSDDMGIVVMQRRKYLKLTRREIANKTGMKHSTVSTYENKWTSRKYWELTGELVKARVI